MTDTKTDEQVNLEILTNTLACAKHTQRVYAEQNERLESENESLRRDIRRMSEINGRLVNENRTLSDLVASKQATNAEVARLTELTVRLFDKIMALVCIAYDHGASHEEICDYVLKHVD